MHGYGVNKGDFSDLLEVVASRGAAAIAIGLNSIGRLDDAASMRIFRLLYTSWVVLYTLK